MSLQYLPQLMRNPCPEAMEIPTIFAEAPIGVALPPISVPIARDQARTGRAMPEAADRLLITGIIVGIFN